MNLPAPTQDYSPANEAATRRALEQEDRRNRKIGADVEMGRERLVLKSPDGSRWAIKVGDDGVLDTVAL